MNTPPTKEELKVPILHVLNDRKEADIRIIGDHVAKAMKLSEGQKRQLGKAVNSKHSVFRKRIRGALRELRGNGYVKLGSRGCRSITEAGKEALQMKRQPGKKQLKDNALTGRIGESRVVSELGRRGISATGFSGNMPVIDVVAYRQGATCSLQVKAWRKGNMSIDAERYLSIRFEGDHQFVDGLNEEAIAASGNVIFVFVSIGETAADDRFFILRHRDVAEKLYKQRTARLEKTGNILPRKPRSTFATLNQNGLASYENNWGLIEAELSQGSVTELPEDRESYRKWLVSELGRLEQ